MSRSVYSVILSDGLVRDLDAAAYKKGVSRSTMLEKILSEYLTVETPSTRMESTFSMMQRLIDEWSGLRFINQPSASMAQVLSALVYRYNPTVKYSLELFPSGSDLGVVKVSLRTQNAALIDLMTDFYDFFCGLESEFLGERDHGYEGGKFVRVLKRRREFSAGEEGEAIAFFIKSFNYLLNEYFSGLDDPDATKRALAKKYGREICKNIKV